MQLTTKLSIGAIMVLVIASCSTRSMDTIKSEFQELKGPISKTYSEATCGYDCINLNDPDPYYKMSDSQTDEWGGNPNGKGNASAPQHSKTVSYEVYNTATDFVVEVFYERSNGNSADLIEVSVNGIIEDEENVASGSTTTFSFPLAGGWQACDEINFAIHQEGQGAPIDLDGAYSLFEVCGCDESFTYVDNGDNTYTFTYIPEEDMESAELVFTFAQGVSVSGLAGWSSHGVTRQNTMNLLACEEYTWTVELVANCSGNSPQSNVWTDFKVNDLSKKADPGDKFIQSCQ